MTILLMIFGASVLGGLAMFDYEQNGENDEEDDDARLATEPTGPVINSDDEDLDLNSSSPLDIALENRLDDEQTLLDVVEGHNISSETNSLVENSHQDLTIYDGVSDEEIGNTDKSFGIAHRFHENEVQTDTLIGGEGDDTIYGGVGSTVFSGGGADSIEVFVPAGLFGQELFVVQDFSPIDDTLTVFLELDEFPSETNCLPEIRLDNLPSSMSQIAVNETPVAAINQVNENTPIAVSVDGHGEIFHTPNGIEIGGSDLDEMSIRVVFLSNIDLYGL